MNKLTTLYTDMLKSLGCEVHEDFSIHHSTGMDGSVVVPLEVELNGVSLPLMMPDTALIRSGNWNEMVAFHPGCENRIFGQSEVFNKLLSLVALRLHNQILIVGVRLLELAANKDDYTKYTSELRRLLQDLSDASPTTLKFFRSVGEKSTGISGAKPFVALKVHRGQSIGGVKYDRVCKLIAPILNEEGEDQIWGVAGSSKNVRTIKKLLQIVFPPMREVGVNGSQTPYLDVLMEMYVKTAQHLNGLRKVMGRNASYVKDIDLSWYIEYPNLKKHVQTYLPQALPGNQGRGGKEIQATPQEEPAIVESPATIPVASLPQTKNVGDPSKPKLGMQRIGQPAAPVSAPAPAPAPVAAPAYYQSAATPQSGYNYGAAAPAVYGAVPPVAPRQMSVAEAMRQARPADSPIGFGNAPSAYSTPAPYAGTNYVYSGSGGGSCFNR